MEGDADGGSHAGDDARIDRGASGGRFCRRPPKDIASSASWRLDDRGYVDLRVSLDSGRVHREEPRARDCRWAGVRGSRRTDELRTENVRPLPPRGRPSRQDPQGRQTGRSPRRATHEVRLGHQPPDREGPRTHDPAVGVAAGGPGHRVMDRRAFITIVGASSPRRWSYKIDADLQDRLTGAEPPTGV